MVKPTGMYSYICISDQQWLYDSIISMTILQCKYFHIPISCFAMLPIKSNGTIMIAILQCCMPLEILYCTAGKFGGGGRGSLANRFFSNICKRKFGKLINQPISY